MNYLSTAHKVQGLLFALLFLGTGIYMYQSFPELYQRNETMRMMYRANHIYILMSALVNLLVGVYMVKAAGKICSIIQLLGSVLMLVAPVLLFLAFVNEPAQLNMDHRPYTFFGVVFLATGASWHFLINCWPFKART